MYLHKNVKKDDVRFGITKETARQLKYTGEMKNLPIDFAKKYYNARYWKPLNLEGITKFDVCYYLFETAIICGDDGVTVAAKHLQDAMNYIRSHLGESDSLWNELTGDYEIDARTINALKKLFKYPTKRITINGGTNFDIVQGTNMDKRLVAALKSSLSCWSAKNRPEHFSWIRWSDQHCPHEKKGV